MKSKTLKEEAAYIKGEKQIIRAFGRVFSGDDGQIVLNKLIEKFETDKPCFQGAPGSFDPLDAMRRDAYREVILYIIQKINIALKQGQQETE